MALIAFAPLNLSAQTASRNLGQEQAGNQALALSQDVTRPFGEYRYLPQSGLYKDVALEDAADDFKEGVRRVGAFLANINLLTGWSQVNPDGFSTTFVAGVGPFRLPYLGAQWGSPYYGNYAGLQFRAGPVLVDNFYLGYGLIYDDLQGTFPGRDQIPPDDRWAQIVSLSFRASFAIGNSIGVSIQPFLYWLPDIGKVGWGLPGPLAGFMGYQPNAMALFQIAWNKQLGDWNFSVYDVFNPRIFQYNIWDVFLSSQPTFGDLTPIERVGRYSLGYGAPGDLNNYNPQARAGIHPSNWNGVSGYFNSLGARAVGTLGPTTKTLFYLYRNDYWNSQFQNLSNNILGGAYIQNGDPYFSTYAGYNFASMNPYSTFLNWAVVGAQKQMGPFMRLYAQGGYSWYTGDQKGPSGALGTLGLVQSLGQRTSHYLEAGRRVYTPVTGPYGIQNYLDYRINHMLGSSSIITAFAGVYESRTENAGYNLKAKYAGLMLNTMLTMRLSVFALSGWSNTASDLGSYVYDTWTHRFGLRHNVTQNIQAQAFYQYLEVSTNSSAVNYSEHYIYLGVTKRF